MFRRLHTLFVSIFIFIAVTLTFPVRAAGSADDYKTWEYYQNAGLDFINAAEAYALGYTGQGIILALFDAPARIDHQEFWGKNYLNRYITAPIEEWSDDNSHGTHVAAIMTANKNNLGMHGVAFDAGLLSLGVNDFSDDNILALYPKTFENSSIKIINNSWGGQIFPEYELKPEDAINDPEAISPEVRDVFRKAVLNYDKVLVFAAGNTGHLSADANPSIVYAEPAMAGNMINVIAFDPTKKTDDVDFLANFTEHALFIEENSIAAPGVQIYSAIASGNGGSYKYDSGTSMAAPHVSGALGLVQQAFPYMSGKELVDTVLSTANNSFARPRYTVAVQEETGEVNGVKKSVYSVYLVYFDNSGVSEGQRDQDLQDYYAASSEIRKTFPTLNDFLYYYTPPQDNDLPYYGQKRYYLDVPPGIMYGQGLLDVGKAVRGPGLLNARRLADADYDNSYGRNQALYTIDTKGYNSIWSNDIGEKRVEKYSSSDGYEEFYKQLYGGFFENGLYGPGCSYAEGEVYGEDYYNSLNDDIEKNILYKLHVGLRKTGEGILALTGNNIYQGDSVVTGGTLQIDGQVATNVYSEPGGTVAGSGTIVQNLTNSGTVQPGSWGNAGQLTVGGDFISNGLIKIIIQNNTPGELNVAGNADVNGSRVTAGGIAVPKMTYQFLNASIGISGNLYGVQFSPFLRTNPSYGGNIAKFQVEKTAALNSLANLNSSQAASAGALEDMYLSMETQGQTWPDELLLIYNTPTEAGARTMFQETYGGTQASLAGSLPLREQFGQTINSRFAALKARDNLAARDNWWVKFIDGGKTVNEDSDSGLPKIKPNRSGFITGYDRKINQSWQLGALFGYGKGNLFTPDSHGDSQDRRLGLYGNYNRRALDLNIYLATGRQSHDVKRSLPSFGFTANSNYHGKTWEMGVKTKYDLNYGREKPWHIAPYAALDVERYNQDSYRESGAGALSQQGEKLLNIYSTAGAGLEASRKINKGHFLVTAGYKRVLNGANPEIKVNFAGNTQDKFSLRGNKESRDWLVLGVSAEGELAKNWTVSAALQGEFSGRGTAHNASITFKRYW